jgi:hypothetical protein
LVTHVYEPFDYPIGGQLAGMNGGIGLSGVWNDGHDWGGGTASVYDVTSMPIVFGYGSLNWDGVVNNLPPQTGGFMGLTSPTIVPGDSWEVWRPLAQDAGTMAGDDNVLWASFVLHNAQAQHIAFALATDCFYAAANNMDTTGSYGSGAGNGIGISGEAGIERYALNPVVFNGGVPVASADNPKRLPRAFEIRVWRDGHGACLCLRGEHRNQRGDVQCPCLGHHRRS